MRSSAVVVLAWFGFGFLPPSIQADTLTISSLPSGITQIAEPFTGDLLETYEQYPVGGIASPLTIFDGQATISSDFPVIWRTTSVLGSSGGFGLGPFPARAFDGTLGYGNSASPGTTLISFESPVSEFGGYWGYAINYPAATITFYDSQGSSIGADSFTYTSPNSDGTLQWQGWHSTVPVASVTCSGDWVVNDSLRITLVPEPSAVALLGLGSLALVMVRQKKQRSLSPSHQQAGFSERAGSPRIAPGGR